MADTLASRPRAGQWPPYRVSRPRAGPHTDTPVLELNTIPTLGLELASGHGATIQTLQVSSPTHERSLFPSSFRLSVKSVQALHC